MERDNKPLKLIFLILLLKIFISACFAQQSGTPKDSYVYTTEEELEIIVHIWGEIKRPGQYIVPDGTNVLELISLAGGPTEYSNLNSVRVTTHYFPLEEENINQRNPSTLKNKEIYKINLKRYLKDENYKQDLRLLKPGDVVLVNKNFWFRFQTILQTIYQVAVITQGLYWFLQIFYNK